jgi:hypothetical protein
MVRIKINAVDVLGLRRGRRGRSHRGVTCPSALAYCIGSFCINVVSFYLFFEEMGCPDKGLDEGMS